ncbi:MAG: protoporphyrinogen oxidase [Actinobacteria bacterium]|nr:MAG: protoporphyrinogen oxidase [Actinomycetota bacterium]
MAPDLADAAAGRRSLLLGLRSWPRPADGPVFLTVRGGLSRLVERLAARLPDVRLREPVGSLRDLDADHVVLALPAFVAAPLLEERSPDAARELRAVEHASVRIVTLAYRREVVAERLDGTGFLVPRTEGWLVTACTWLSSKWPALATDDHVLVRASTGRFGDDRALSLAHETLVERVHDELTRAMALRDTPDAWEVADWPRSFAQYEPGHLERVERIESALARDAPGIVVTGGAYRGLGLASCVRQGEEASRKVLAA